MITGVDRHTSPTADIDDLLTEAGACAIQYELMQIYTRTLLCKPAPVVDKAQAAKKTRTFFIHTRDWSPLGVAMCGDRVRIFICIHTHILTSHRIRCVPRLRFSLTCSRGPMDDRRSCAHSRCAHCCVIVSLPMRCSTRPPHVFCYTNVYVVCKYIAPTRTYFRGHICL
jgi:hypothetical protein